MWRLANAIAWMCVIATAACAVARAAPARADHDPFYSDEYDALAACAEGQAPSYRYDYDRPEISSSEQVASFLRRTCAKEIAALARIVAPTDRNGAPEEMAGELDAFIVQPFFGEPSAKSLEERFDTLPAPGASVLERGGRRTYFRSARGLSEREVVGVLRWDALRLTHYRTMPEPDFVYFGRRDRWTYSYERTFDIWKGSIAKDGITARIYCLPKGQFPMPEFRYGCDLKIPGLLSLKTSARAPYSLMLCNPGHFEAGHISFRPLPPAGSPRDLARAARLSIDDGAPILLPDGDKCLTLDGALRARIKQAKRLRSSFVGRFDTRTNTTVGSGDAVAAGLVLLEWLHERTFDQRVASEMEADQATLRERAQPYTLADALSAYDEWDASVACARAHGSDGRACADRLADLVWRAQTFDAKDDLEADRLAQHPADTAKSAEVLGLVRAAAERRPARAARAHFADGEKAASVMGHAGFSGSVETTSDGAFSNRFQRFGYAIDERKAWGVIPGDRFGGGPEPSLQSTVITCDGAQSPSCTIRVSTRDRKGAFTLHTDGTWHDAVPCVAYAGWKLGGWRLYDYAYIFDNRLGLLDENGCVTTGRPAVMRSLMHQEYGPALVEPGSDPEKSKEIQIQQNVTFALALARFLAERVAE